MRFSKEKLNQDVLDCDLLLSKFKFLGLTSAFKKFQTKEKLLDFEESAIINFANTFTSVCLNPQIMGRKVVDIVKKVNRHSHTKACRKYSESCRFSFPKFPTWKTIVASPHEDVPNEQKEKYEKVLHDVKKVLLDDKRIDKIMEGFDKDKESKEEYHQN